MRPAARRVWLHVGVSDRACLGGCARPSHLRRYQRSDETYHQPLLCAGSESIVSATAAQSVVPAATRGSVGAAFVAACALRGQREFLVDAELRLDGTSAEAQSRRFAV